MLYQLLFTRGMHVSFWRQWKLILLVRCWQIMLKWHAFEKFYTEIS